MLALTVASGLALAQGGPREGPRPTQALYDEVAAQDRIVFAAIFDTCDMKVLAGALTDDVEMYHDKGGHTFTNSKQFVSGVTAICKRQETGEDYRSRREIVPGSMKIYPLNNYGAIQVGEHRFYRLTPGKPEQLSEVSLFTHVWKREPSGAWKLARVLSYDHRLVP